MRLRTVVLVAVLSAIAGCYKIDDDGATTTLTFSRNFLLGLTAALIVAGVVGAWLATKPTQRSTGLILSAVVGVLGVVLLPGIWRDRVVITSTTARQSTGPWFAPTVNHILYADVESITIKDVRGRGSRTKRVWFVQQVNGETYEIYLWVLWENNEDLVVRKLREYGVKFR